MRRALWLACAALGAAGSLPAQSVTARVGGELTAPPYSYVSIPVTVDMSASGGQLLGSYTARLTWNPSTMYYYGSGCCGQADSSAQGNFAAPYVNTDSAYYYGILKFSSVSPTGAGGLVTIANLRFYVYPDTVGNPIALSFSEMSAAGTFTSLLPILTVQGATFCGARGRWGDLDRDGLSNSRDALFVLSRVVGLPVDTLIADTSVADVDADGRTTSRDALIILSYAVGLPITGQRVLLPVASAACATGSARQVAVLPSAIELVVGQNYRLVAQSTDSAGRVVSVQSAGWRSSDFSIAAVEADGTVTPRAAGTATITAEIGPGVTASATVTVIPRRPNWYVAIAATGSPVQNGSAAHPFEHPMQAFPYVTEGDTVRVGPGTYYWSDDGELQQGIVLQGGTPGDTTTRPVFRDPQGYNYALWLRGGQRTVVRNVVFQSFSEAIDLDGVRNLAVEDTKFLTGQYGDGIYHCGAEMDTVRIDRSVFQGDSATRGGTAVYYGGCPVISAHLTIFRDSKVRYMYDGLYLYGADSLLVLRSQFLDLYDNGVYVSQGYNERPALVVSQSQFLRNYYGAIEVNYMRRVVVDTSTIGSHVYYSALDVYDADTVRVRGNSFPGDSVSASPYCYSYYSVINVYRAQRTELRDNVLTDAYCTGVLVEHADRVGRVILSHNRIDGAATYGIKASAPVIALDHNVVRNIGTPVNYAEASYGVKIHSAYGVDSLTAVGDSLMNIDYVGFDVDSARAARVDSLYVNGTGQDSAGWGAGIAFGRGRLDVTHTRVFNAFGDGILVQGAGAVMRSRGNLVRNSRDGLGTWTNTPPGPDSMFSVHDTVQQTWDYEGIWAGRTRYALVDSAVVDTIPVRAGIWISEVGRAIVRDSKVRASAYGLVAQLSGRVEVRRNTTVRDTVGIYLQSLSDSAVVVGNTIDTSYYDGIGLYIGTRARVDSNVVRVSGKYGAYVYVMSDSVFATGNAIDSTTLYDGLNIDSVQSARAAGNTISRSRLAGLVVARVRDAAVVSGNTIDRSGSDGINASFGTLLRADSNRSTNNAMSGLVFYTGSGGRATRNRFQNNGWYGVAIDGSGTPTSPSVANNTIQGNLRGGAGNFSYPYATMDADSNYWGDPNGPRCDSLVTGVPCNATSLGDSVVSSGITFVPFLTSAPPGVPAAPPALAREASVRAPVGPVTHSVPAYALAPRGRPSGAMQREQQPALVARRQATLRLPVAASPMVSPPPRRYGPALSTTAPVPPGATPEQRARIERRWQRRQEQEARRAEVEARQQAEREAQRGTAAPQSPRD